MPKRQKIPSGLCTGTEAARRLRIPVTTFYDQIRKGRLELQKIVPPGARRNKEGYFSIAEVDKLAQAKEIFTLLYSVEPVEFTRAQSEDDVRGIVDMCVAIYGAGGTPSLETRLAIWKKSPMSYYVLKQENIVVGYASLIWFNDVALDNLMGATKKQSVTQSAAGKGIYSVTGPENINQIVLGEPIESLFISLGTRPGMSHQQQRLYGFRTIQGTIEAIAEFHKLGSPIGKLLGTGEKPDGISLARKFGAEEIKYPGDSVPRFELDLEHAESRIARAMRGEI
jgi:hypothetical protein